MTHQRPPILKFNFDFLTHKVEITLLEEVQHLIFKWNLDFEIEKKKQSESQNKLHSQITNQQPLELYCIVQKSLEKNCLRLIQNWNKLQNTLKIEGQQFHICLQKIGIM